MEDRTWFLRPVVLKFTSQGLFSEGFKGAAGFGASRYALRPHRQGSAQPPAKETARLIEKVAKKASNIHHLKQNPEYGCRYAPQYNFVACRACALCSNRSTSKRSIGWCTRFEQKPFAFSAA